MKKTMYAYRLWLAVDVEGHAKIHCDVSSFSPTSLTFRTKAIASALYAVPFQLHQVMVTAG